MRYISINGAVFIFLQRGEKLKENEGLPLNGYPDRRYILWPRTYGWDVCVKVITSGKVCWKPIKKDRLKDEVSAWQAAWIHLKQYPTLVDRYDENYGAVDKEFFFHQSEVNKLITI